MTEAIMKHVSLRYGMCAITNLGLCINKKNFHFILPSFKHAKISCNNIYTYNKHYSIKV